MQIILVLFLALIVVSAAFNAFGPSANFIRFHKASSSIKMSDVDPSSQIFIGNLPFTADEDFLSNAISQMYSTPFTNIKIVKDRTTGKSRGFGYVSFNSKEEAAAAVEALSSFEIDSRAIKVDLVTPRAEGERRERPERTERAPRANRDNEFKAFVGNLDFKTTQAELGALCESKLGPDFVKRIDLVTDRETRKFRGFGYLIVSSEDDVQKVIQTLNGELFLNRDLRVDVSVKKDPSERAAPREFAPRAGGSAPAGEKNSVYIGNLPWDATQDIIEDMLTDLVGPELHTNVRIATDRETGKPRGFCHVDFKDAESMEKALVSLEGVEIYGRALKVDKAQLKPKTFGGGDGGFRGAPRGRSNDRYGDSGGDRGGSFNSW